MNVLVTTEARFDRTPDGACWTQTVFDRSFWSRYLDVFDGVRVLARVRHVPQPPSGWRRVDGERIIIVPVPYYHGALQYLARRHRVVAAVRTAAAKADAVVLRVPAVFAPMLHSQLIGERRPYAVEVVGDPEQIFAPGAIAHPLRPVVRRLLARQQRIQCLGAAAAGYVTRGVLQRIYPPAATALSTNYSSIELDPAAFASEPRTTSGASGAPRIVAVGSLEQLYKGPDVLIEAVSRLLARGVDVCMVWLGDGALRRMLEHKVSALRLERRIRFAGELLPGGPVRDELDRADLFVMTSRSEGLPRAMIEAMARALPCIGTHVGGIPELLTPEDMVAPGDPAALAEAIARVLGDPARMARMSARNLERAAEYRADVLRARRIALYLYLRERTAAWAQAKSVIAAEPVTLTS